MCPVQRRQNRRPTVAQGGFSLVENLVALAIVVLFFAALYTLNSQSLYLLSAGRGAAIANGCLQDRVEQLRSCTWLQLTDANYLKISVLNSSTNGAANLGLITETVTLNAYPVAISPAISVVRTNGTTTIASSNATLVSRDVVRVDTTLVWSGGPGGRSRKQARATLIAKQP